MEQPFEYLDHILERIGVYLIVPAFTPLKSVARTGQNGILISGFPSASRGFFGTNTLFTPKGELLSSRITFSLCFSTCSLSAASSLGLLVLLLAERHDINSWLELDLKLFEDHRL